MWQFKKVLDSQPFTHRTYNFICLIETKQYPGGNNSLLISRFVRVLSSQALTANQVFDGENATVKSESRIPLSMSHKFDECSLEWLQLGPSFGGVSLRPINYRWAMKEL